MQKPARRPTKRRPSSRKAAEGGTDATAPAVRQESAPEEPPRILSSSHLVDPACPQLSELEFALILVSSAFSKWMVHCMATAGLRDLAPLAVILLHHVNSRGRDKRLADICFVINEEAHTVSYSLRKLVALGVVAQTKKGKDVTYATTEKGRTAIARYAESRSALLIGALHPTAEKNREIGEAARVLRELSGVYGLAARSAASM